MKDPNEFIPLNLKREHKITINCNLSLKDKAQAILKKRGVKFVDWFEGMLLACVANSPRGDIKLKGKRK